ncbi:MAG: hypothetical protein ABJK59_01045 [Erythrobacter sp.]
MPNCGETRGDTEWSNVPVDIEEGESQIFSGNDFEVELTRRKWPE